MKRLAMYCGILSIALVAAARGQLSQVATGTPAFNSYAGGTFDTVNLGNLNVHFSVPVFHKAGRGMPFGFDLTYDSSVWTPTTTGTTTQWTPLGNWGWQTGSPFGYITYTTATSTCQYYVSQTGQWYTAYTVYDYQDWIFVDRLGSKHPLTGYTQSWQGGTVAGTSCDIAPATITSAT